jgi:flagellar hook protein FlgE
MYTGVSGLDAESAALGVVGDNLANSNTVGFKEARAIFADVLGSAMRSNEPGAGVRMARSQQIFAQGALISTGQPTDVALSGDGFLVVSGNVSGIEGQYYTRAGQLTIGSDGALVNAAGLKVQGYPSDGKGGFSMGLGPITLPTAAIPPKATSTLSVSANLDASATAPAAAWDPQDPGATSNLGTSITVYDSLGTAHSVDVYFRKSGSGAWEYHAIAKASDLAAGGTGNTEVASGTLAFDANGMLQTQTTTTPASIDFKDAATGQTLAFDFGAPTPGGKTGQGGITQYGLPSNIGAQKQDGYASGSLAGVKIEDDGTVNAAYSNGATVAAGKLAIAKFRSNDGLARAGNSMWAATQESGDAAVGEVGSGGRASLVSGSLEQSNVDVTQQFVELIAHQRAFQASSKTITTADQMLQELMTIKQ